MRQAIGWIKIHRQITESFIYPNLRKFTEYEAWLHLLLNASFSDSRILDGNRVIEVKRGDILTSEIKLSLEWRWSRDKVRGFLELLQKEKMILKRSTTKFTIITLCNYATYQDLATAEPTTTRQRNNNKTTTNLQPPYTLEEGKEDIKNVEEDKEGKEVTALVMPYNSEKFLTVWNILRKQPKWKKKTNEALQANLKKLSKYPEDVAIEIMENSIAGNYQGLFETQKSKNNGTSKAEQLTADVQEAFNRRFGQV